MLTVILIIQVIILLLLTAIVVVGLVYFPYPSPLVRRILTPRKRWPESQIRDWLRNGRFHRSFLAYFYRDPERVAGASKGYLAPADGLVTSVEVRDGIYYIVIALSFWDMHVQRSPLAGKVLKVETQGDTFMDGEGRDFAFLRAKTCPVQKRLVMRTDFGEIAIRLITSLAARRVEVWVEEGDVVERGQRIGRILLGSTVVLELPTKSPLQVRVGEHIRAGETVVAGALLFS